MLMSRRQSISYTQLKTASIRSIEDQHPFLHNSPKTTAPGTAWLQSWTGAFAKLLILESRNQKSSPIMCHFREIKPQAVNHLGSKVNDYMSVTTSNIERVFMHFIRKGKHSLKTILPPCSN